MFSASNSVPTYQVMSIKITMYQLCYDGSGQGLTSSPTRHELPPGVHKKDMGIEIASVSHPPMKP